MPTHDGDHYFTARPGAAPAPRPVVVDAGGEPLELRSDAGTFSPRRLDPGTAILLDGIEPPRPDVAHLLDLGCGWGPIAIRLAHWAPHATVWAVDVNQRAVELCRENARALDCPGVRALVVPPDDPTAGIPGDVRFDAIWSNPPIRIGKPALHALLLAALDRLAPRGRAHLVVQRHLGADSLQRWLVAQGWPCERVGSRRGYRLLQVRRPTDR